MSTVTDVLYINGNNGSVFPFLQNGTGAISWNYSGGGAEVNFWNLFTGFAAPLGFDWRLVTATNNANPPVATASQQLMLLDCVGKLTTSGLALYNQAFLTATPTIAQFAATSNVSVTNPPERFPQFTSTDDSKPLVGAVLLLIGQSDASQNGLWMFNGAGQPMTRAVGFDISAEWLGGVIVYCFDTLSTTALNVYMAQPARGFVLGASALNFSLPPPYNQASTPGARPITVSTGLAVYGVPSVQGFPVGDDIFGWQPNFPLLSSLDVRATTGAEANGEYLVNIGLVSRTGAIGKGNKVALYAGAVSAQGSGDVWAFNPVVTMIGSSGIYNAQGIEIDVQNFNQSYTIADTENPNSPRHLKFVAGISVTGTNQPGITNTAAIIIAGGPPAQWDAGIYISPGSQALGSYTIADNSSSLTSIYIAGNHAAAALDASAAKGNPSIFLPGIAGYGFSTFVSVNNKNYYNYFNGMSYGSSNENPVLTIGDVSATKNFMLVRNTIYPYANNTLFLGGPTLAFNAIYSVNGCFTTSELASKENVAETGLGLNFVSRLKPVQFTRPTDIDGEEEREIEQDVLDVEPMLHTIKEPTLRDGRWVMAETPATMPVQQYDEFPLWNDDGTPVTSREPVFKKDAAGEVVFDDQQRPVVEGHTERQQMHRVPRRKIVKKTVVRSREVPGRRVHHGYVQEDVAALAMAFGQDMLAVEPGGLFLHHLHAPHTRAIQQLLAVVQDLLDDAPRDAIKAKLAAMLAAPVR